jgi:hypothetical protein
VSVGTKWQNTCKNTSSNAHFGYTMSKSSLRYTKLSFGSPNSESGWKSYGFQKIVRRAKLNFDTGQCRAWGEESNDHQISPWPPHSPRSPREALSTPRGIEQWPKASGDGLLPPNHLSFEHMQESTVWSTSTHWFVAVWGQLHPRVEKDGHVDHWRGTGVARNPPQAINRTPLPHL